MRSGRWTSRPSSSPTSRWPGTGWAASSCDAGRSRRRSRAQERARKLEPKNGAFAADLCRTLFEAKDPPRAVAECRAAVTLDPANPLARYELLKALVAKGDCAAAQAELAKFRALPAVKPEAKAQADAIAKSCTRGEKVALPTSTLPRCRQRMLRRGPPRPTDSRLRHGDRVANLP